MLTTLLLACGGGSGDGGEGSNSGGGDSNNGDGNTSDSNNNAVSLNLNLSQGDFWEFFWTSESISFAQPNTTNTDIDVGRYRITLGASMLIQGQEAFPVTVTGETGSGNKFAPRWTHLAVDTDGSFLGSTDGASLQPIFDASSGNSRSNGMFVDFGGNDLSTSNGTFSGVYNQLSAIISGREQDDPRCESILGITICGDNSTRFSEQEFYKPGIGAIGYALRIFYSDNGGGFFTSTTLNDTIELIDSSFQASDGSSFNLPPWEEMDSLNTARSDHKAVVLNGLIYVLGGFTSSTATNTVEIYNPATNNWSFGDSMPTSQIGPAVAINGRIYVQTFTNSVLIYNPNASLGFRWSTATPANGTGIVMHDAAVYNDATFGQIMVGANQKPAGAGAINAGGYAPDTNQWLTSNGAPQGFAELLRFTTEVVNNSMYLIGGFGRSGFIGDDRGARDNIMEFDIIGDQWISTLSGRLNLARDNHASTVLNDKIYVFGGNPVGCSSISGTCTPGNPFREAEVYDPATRQSIDLPLMFQPRQDFAAVTLNGSIYVIGGKAGSTTLAKVERYTPN